MAERICFVIAPIGDEGSEVRKRSDLILKYVIAPAASECGYKALRADKISEPGMITSQVIQHIVEDPLVIADLTGRNPNVFYELAIRHAIRRPFVQIIQKGEQIPFDVAGTRTIQVDHHDLESVAEAKREVISQISSLEADSSRLETPISVSLDLQTLRQSGSPEQRGLADVLAALSDLRANMMTLGQRVEYSMDAAATLARRQEFATEELLRRQLAVLSPIVSPPGGSSLSAHLNELARAQARLPDQKRTADPPKGTRDKK